MRLPSWLQDFLDFLPPRVSRQLVGRLVDVVRRLLGDLLFCEPVLYSVEPLDAVDALLSMISSGTVYVGVVTSDDGDDRIVVAKRKLSDVSVALVMAYYGEGQVLHVATVHFNPSMCRN